MASSSGLPVRAALASSAERSINVSASLGLRNSFQTVSLPPAGAPPPGRHQMASASVPTTNTPHTRVFMVAPDGAVGPGGGCSNCLSYSYRAADERGSVRGRGRGGGLLLG